MLRQEENESGDAYGADVEGNEPGGDRASTN